MNKRWRSTIGTGSTCHIAMSLVPLAVGLAWPLLGQELSDDDRLWRERIGYNPQVHGTLPQTSDDDVIGRLPYAYYPTPNQIEVMFDFAAAVKQLLEGVVAPAAPPSELRVVVYPLAGAEPVASQRIVLDERGRGHGLFTLPKLAAGVYRVEYAFGGVVLPASRTFRRSYFAFEGCTLGSEHKVYAPFTPVVVQGRTVSVVERSYTVNAQGLFDSVVSQGREMLAAPMALVVELENGERVSWSDDRVAGQALHPDTAVFETAAQGSGLGVQGSVTVEEDGCAKIELTLRPEADRQQSAAPDSNRQQATGLGVTRAWLEIALKESEAPLCHLVGMNSMRHNYAGHVPRGGRIVWLNQPWRPARFEVEPFPEGEIPASYEVWDATRNMHWGSQRWDFAPYVWLGAEERGLAWFGDHVQGYARAGGRGIQRLAIEPGRVVLRVELIQKPVLLDAPRTFEFGLQASPTKPMRPDWRGHQVPGGGGMSVVVWGGFNCSSKYPVNNDWSIVDKIMEGRQTGKVDTAFFEAKVVEHGLQNAKANNEPWLKSVLHFAGREAGRGPKQGTTVYFEEHQTNGNKPEMIEYMDEWADTTWSRFRYYQYSGYQQTPRVVEKGTWGPEVRSANSASHRDFVVYYANEWMRRGVGIYYDNTYPMIDYNRQHFDGRDIRWSSSIWGHREYYKRVWKRSRELMASGESPLPLHIVGHVTNCQVLPYTTWWDATLGVESPGQWAPEPGLSPEQRQKSLDQWGFVILPTPKVGAAGQALPYPPDYLRAMECGRMAGLIPHYRHLLRSEDAFGGIGIGYGATDKPKEEIVRHRQLSDKAMGLVHEIRGGGSAYDHDDIRTLMDAFAEFGYGKPEVRVHNYWDEPPFLAVDNPEVKWIALERRSEAGFRGQGKEADESEVGGQRSEGGSGNQAPSTKHQEPVLALLQSYAAEACEVRIAWAPGAAVLDLFTRRLVDAGVPLAMPEDYGTRLLLVGDPALLAPQAWADGVLLQADFEFGLPPGWRSRGGGAPRIVADSATPGNRVLRIVPGHPSQNVVQGQTAGDYELSFRFRLPELAEKPPHRQFYGFLQLLHRQVGGWPKQSGQVLSLGVQLDGDGQPVLGISYGTRRDGQDETFQAVATNRFGEVGKLVPLDAGWHTIGIAVRGQRHTLAVDGIELFSGETDVTNGGALVLGPGWSSWPDGIPYVEIDDLVCRRPDGR